jgi:methyl-accepting chemotaxis protein
MWRSKLSIQQRLWALTIAALASLLLISSTAFWTSQTLSGSIHDITESDMPSVILLKDLQRSFVELRLTLVRHILSENDQQMAGYEKDIEALSQSLRSQIELYEKTLVSDEIDGRMTQDDRSLVSAYIAALPEVTSKSRANDDKGALQLIDTLVKPLGDKAYAAIGQHVAHNIEGAENNSKAGAEAIARAHWLIGIPILLGAALVLIVSLRLIHHIGHDLRAIREAMRVIGRDFDFTRRVGVYSDDELGYTAKTINELLDTMQGSLKGIAESASAVARSATELSTSSHSVTQAATAQNGAAGSMTASVDELASGLAHADARASQANQASSESGRLANSGRAVIGQTVQDIRDISEAVTSASERITELEQSSEQISGVVQVIKEVADQTNLLALNAAIEAARAGEQGRGFAVVADEVRKLAERTGKATQEIAATIEAMRNSAHTAVASMSEAVSRVHTGVERASHASSAIEQIGAGSEQVVSMVSEISSTIREHSGLSAQMSSMLSYIGSLSNQSADAAQDSARLAHQLDGLAAQMQQEISRYHL